MTTPPFGAPPAPNPFQPPGHFSSPGPRRRLSGKVKGLIAGAIVLALGLGVLAAFGVGAIARSAGPPSAGSCLYLSQAGLDTQSYHDAACSDSRATYRVDDVIRGRSSCHGEDYVRFEIYGTSRTSRTPQRTLCLALNVSNGECLRDVDDESSISKVACSDPSAEARAVVHNGKRSSRSCGEEDAVLVYAGPPVRTVCLQPTGENI
ncbi:LppU/SCO3897 family protein [Amycolatopsis jiangsuensis]|uniref:Uncharacterized protein n=1 Tax=Amycolatopsis jiangsuensis TaxID=1181879 RepID=A0A840J225_9PSEU|nr:hypothetical protein [Amycolatopsis jiangsuensis]MBB4687953.1 hypothetical protein [Amycolatopsis jiangsuensis]